jgi:hypothetical protein
VIGFLFTTIRFNTVSTFGDYELNDVERNNYVEETISIESAKEVTITKPKIELKKISLKKKFSGVNKTYMDLKCITNKSSKQYKMKSDYKLDSKGHYYINYKDEKFYVVALGNYFGKIGDKFKITLSSGKTFYAIKGDTKSNRHTKERYAHKTDGSVIEFIINTKVAKKYYGSNNGYVCNGNLNNSDLWNGKIVNISKVIE